MIAPAVYDDRLAEAVMQYNTDDERTPAMCPFGMAGIRYSCQNVFMTRETESARITHRMYTRENSREESKDEYGYWSDIARTLHAPYKMFGIGFSGMHLTEDERRRENALTTVSPSYFRVPSFFLFPVPPGCLREKKRKKKGKKKDNWLEGVH